MAEWCRECARIVNMPRSVPAALSPETETSPVIIDMVQARAKRFSSGGDGSAEMPCTAAWNAGNRPLCVAPARSIGGVRRGQRLRHGMPGARWGKSVR